MIFKSRITNKNLYRFYHCFCEVEIGNVHVQQAFYSFYSAVNSMWAGYKKYLEMESVINNDAISIPSTIYI